MYAQAGIPERLKSADDVQLSSAPKKSDRPAPTYDSLLEPQRSASQSVRPWGEQRRIEFAFQISEDGQAQEGTESWQTQGEILPVDCGIGRDSEDRMGTRRSALRASGSPAARTYVVPVFDKETRGYFGPMPTTSTPLD